MRKIGQLKKKKDFYRVYTRPSLKENGWRHEYYPPSCSEIINDYEYYDKNFEILKTEYNAGASAKKDICLIQFFDGVKFVIRKDEIKELQYCLPDELFEI